MIVNNLRHLLLYRVDLQRDINGVMALLRRLATPSLRLSYNALIRHSSASGSSVTPVSGSNESQLQEIKPEVRWMKVIETKPYQDPDSLTYSKIAASAVLMSGVFRGFGTSVL